MLFWRNVDIDAPGFECTKKVLVLGYENNSAYVTSDAVKNKSLFDAIKLSDGARYAIIPGMTVPVITIEPVGDNTNITNVCDMLFKVFRAGKGEEMQAMRAVKGVLEPQVGADLASKIVSAIKLQYDWETSGELNDVLRIDASDADVDLRAVTMKRLDEMNSRFVQAITSIAPAENYTRFQNAETDTLFIEIPSRGEVADADSVVALIPKQDEVCKPYNDPAAFSADYKNKGLPKYLIAQIEGAKSNNTAELFDNEKMYYTALDEWVHFNMREEFGDADGGVIDKLSEGYLLQLISSIYIWHWRHNPRVPKGIDITSDDDDDAADIGSAYIFAAEQGKDAPDFNAVIILQEFLKEASTVLGYKVYLDALVQIARWGSRKQTAIVFEDYDKEFVLGKGTVGQKMGDLSEYSIVKQDGNDCNLIGVIYDNAQIRDTSLGVAEWKFPVGVVTSTTIESKSGNREEYYMYYHFLDLIKLLDAGEISVGGIVNDNGWKITTDVAHYGVAELVNVYEKIGQTMLQFPFYRSQKLIDLLLELQIANSRIPTNIFLIMNTRVADPNLKASIAKANFTSKEELFDAISQGRITSKVTATELNIAGAILPCYLAMSNLWDGDTTGVIEVWRKAMSGFEGETAWYGAVKRINSFDAVKTTEEPEKTEEPSVIQSMSEANDAVKSESSVTTQTITQPEVTPAAPKPVGGWMKAVPADATLCKVVAGDEVLGYCYVESGVPIPSNPRKTYSRYTIAANKDGRTIGASTVNVYRIFALILHNIFLEDVRGSSLRQVFFEDADTLNAIKAVFQTMGKK